MMHRLSGQDTQRSIRSFVLRNQRMTPAQKASIDQYWKLYGIEAGQELLDFNDLFGRCAPTVLEIGSGNGDLIVELASRNPQRNYVAVEVYRPGVGALLHKTHLRGLSNLKVICEDITLLVEHCMPQRAFTEVMIMFPDPWPKKRHHKRRLIKRGFVQDLSNKIAEQGLLHIATDWQHYADSIYREVASSKCYRYCDTLRLERPTTAFERRAIKDGRKVFNFTYQLI